MFYRENKIINNDTEQQEQRESIFYVGFVFLCGLLFGVPIGMYLILQAVMP